MIGGEAGVGFELCDEIKTADEEFFCDLLNGKLFFEIGFKVQAVLFYLLVLYRKGGRIDAEEGDEQRINKVLHELLIIRGGMVFIVDAQDERNGFGMIFEGENMNWNLVITVEEGAELGRQEMEIAARGKDTETCSLIGELHRLYAMGYKGGDDNKIVFADGKGVMLHS